MKRISFTLPFLLALFVFASGAGPAAAAPVKLTVNSTAQNQLVHKRSLKVTVRAARRGAVRVQAYSATFDQKDRYRPLTRAAWPRFRRKGQRKTVTLRLTSSAAKAAKSCENRLIQARSGKRRSRVRSMFRQGSCAPQAINLSRAATCDFIAAPNPSVCMTPFPSDRYTKAAPSSKTGRLIDFKSAAMPVNKDAKPIDPAAYLASDGFSQGQTLLVRVPGLDTPDALARTNPPSLASPGRYTDAGSPVVVINAKTGQRHPIWVELDSKASSAANTQLMIHPMVNWDAGTRYLVALRNLKSAGGRTLTAPMGFRYYRDVLPTGKAAINQRRSHFEDIFRRLRNRQIKRSDLYLAWDFTVASDESNSTRALTMRDKAFATLDDSDLDDREVAGSAPDFTVTGVDLNPKPEIARLVKGTFKVPCYMKDGYGEPCGPGAVLNLDSGGRPAQNGSYTANFQCTVPKVVTDNGGFGSNPEYGRSLVYGHGLMGSISGEIKSGGQAMLNDRGFVICGTDEIGMSTGDLLTVVKALGDLSSFPEVADRLQQGLLNEMFLARLMIHSDGLASKQAFRIDPGAGDKSLVPGGDGNAAADLNLNPALRTGQNVRAYYRGNSQGGIMGGALTALTPDFDRTSLGVTGMNYSVLLTRSSAWDSGSVKYSTFFNPAYPSELNRPLALGLVQMLWDRGEPNGYAHRMTDNPLPNTPPHKVLMDIAFGDHLVTNWQANVQARTIGAKAMSPFVYDGRWAGVDGQWGIESIAGYPYDGSAITYWDIGPERPGLNPGEVIGTNPPPLTNVAPTTGEDPHEAPRVTPAAVEMSDRFLRDDGAVTNQCGGTACVSWGFTAP
ncbi:MAG: hypothetical protein M9938_04885 [Solirubrobacterales bacterium]|nr:hypothetical protein [Solirubrobacterales bacterium]